MRTTIRFDDELLRDAKARAARAGRTLNEFIEDAVRMAILADVAPVNTPPIPRLAGGRGLRAGVDLDNNAALADLMEEGDRVR